MIGRRSASQLVVSQIMVVSRSRCPPELLPLRLEWADKSLRRNYRIHSNLLVSSYA